MWMQAQAWALGSGFWDLKPGLSPLQGWAWLRLEWAGPSRPRAWSPAWHITMVVFQVRGYALLKCTTYKYMSLFEDEDGYFWNILTTAKGSDISCSVALHYLSFLSKKMWHGPTWNVHVTNLRYQGGEEGHLWSIKIAHLSWQVCNQTDYVNVHHYWLCFTLTWRGNKL